MNADEQPEARVTRACVVKLAWTRSVGAGHDVCRVFMGEDRGHLALVGTLTMRPHEAHDFRLTLVQGVGRLGFRGMYESGWSE